MTSTKPLAGTLIVDLTRMLSGPFCTQVLADLGARVIKVERPDGDDARAIGPFVDEQSAYFMSINRNKESIALDLKRGADRLVFEKLLERADVLVENFRPGTLEKLGYDWPALSNTHPRLVLASISGFGQSGPYSRRPAYDMVVQAMSGMMSVTGQPGHPPTRVGTSIGDLAAGLYGAIAIQAALLRRHRTGNGEWVDVAMLDCQVALLENALARFHVTGVVPGPSGARHPSITPFDMFRTADGWIAIAVGNDALFRRLCGLLCIPEAANDPRFVSMRTRGEHHEALKELIERELGQRCSAQWCELFAIEGIPSGPYNTIKEVVDDPQLRARAMLMPLPYGPAKALTVAGNPIKFVTYPDDSLRAAPALNEHRAQILAELGLSTGQVSQGVRT